MPLKTGVSRYGRCDTSSKIIQVDVPVSVVDMRPDDSGPRNRRITSVVEVGAYRLFDRNTYDQLGHKDQDEDSC